MQRILFYLLLVMASVSNVGANDKDITIYTEEFPPFNFTQNQIVTGASTEVVQQVTMNVDLPGNTEVTAMTCRNCGGALKPENVKMVAGAPMVECPYCGTTYQLTEEPKW